MQTAFVEHDGFQCGYCTSGQICSAIGMLAESRLGMPSYVTEDLMQPAADLTDADRIRILRDLLRTADAIRKSKSAEELRRDEEVRRSLEEPGRQRYIALWERLG